MGRQLPNVEALFCAALEIAEGEARASFLDRECEDPVLRQHVERLLCLDAQAGSFLEAPAGPPTTNASQADDPRLAEQVAALIGRLWRGARTDLPDDSTPPAAELRRLPPTLGMAGDLAEPIAREPELRTLGDFRILREVGRGGMGVVYEAEQISLRRRVAMKILPLAGALDPRHHQRFLLEARAAACLHHTHIVPVHAVGSERGVPYYAMQFIDGVTLAQVLQQLRGPEPAESLEPAPAPASSLGSSSRDRSYIRAVAEHGRQAAEALDHAHGRGIIHRDIKPANLMLDAEGHLWITDFGLAQIQGDSRLTLTGDLLGTLRYMSPEQALGKRVVIDGRTDLYSLGATLYELLALRPVFDGDDRAEILRKIAQDEPTPLRRLNPAVPRDLETIVHKALAKEPCERYATARELADDLGWYLDARPIAARPPGRLERLGKWARRNRTVVAPAALFAVLALVALAGALTWSNNWLSRHGERLRTERDRAKDLSRQLEGQRDLAEQRRRIADRHLHAFRLRQAAEALAARQFERAQEILRDCRPGPGEDDPRAFAWHYLWREARKDVAVLSERTEQVTTLALSPDGRTLATGDRDGTIRLRDPESGQVAMTLQGHQWNVFHLAFSPDGRRLVSVGLHDRAPALKSEVLLWEIDSGRLWARLDGFSDRNVEQVAFDAGGEHLWELSSGDHGPWRLGCWNVRPDRSLSRLVWSRFIEETRPSRAGDGPIGAIESPGAGFRLRDLEEAMNLGWTGTIACDHGQAVAGSPDGHILAVGAGPWNVLWDVRADRERARFPTQPMQGMLSIRFGADSRFLTIEYKFIDRCEVYDVRTGACRTIPPAVADPAPARAQAFSPDGRLFARSIPKLGDPQPTRVWQLDPWHEVAAYPGALGFAHPLLFARDGRSLVVCINSAAVRWNFLPPPEPGQPDGHKDEAWATAFSSDGRLLATGSDDTEDSRTLKVWDAATGRLLRGWKAHEATTAALAFQPGGRLLATAGLLPTENLRLWDADTGRLLATLDGHTDRVRTVAFRPDGCLFASAGSDRTIRLWDVATRHCTATLNGHSDTIRQVVFSPDGRMLASVGADFTVRLWDVERAEEVWHWKGGAKVAAAAFAPDGRTLVWAHEDGIIHGWDLAQKQPLAPLHNENGELRCLAFSPDGRALAAAGKSGSLHLWDPVVGQELLTLKGRPCQVDALAFSPDGSALAACWHDGTVRLVRSR